MNEGRNTVLQGRQPGEVPALQAFLLTYLFYCDHSFLRDATHKQDYDFGRLRQYASRDVHLCAIDGLLRKPHRLNKVSNMTPSWIATELSTGTSVTLTHSGPGIQR